MIRADCIDGPRPCQHSSCRHHLGTDTLESCALDVAHRGEHTLEEVASIYGVTREYVRIIEKRALIKIRRLLGESEPDKPALKKEKERFLVASIRRGLNEGKSLSQTAADIGIHRNHASALLKRNEK